MFRISFIEKYRLFWRIQKKSCKYTVKETTVRHNIQHYTVTAKKTTSHLHRIVNPRNYLNILCSVWVIGKIYIYIYPVNANSFFSFYLPAWYHTTFDIILLTYRNGNSVGTSIQQRSDLTGSPPKWASWLIAFFWLQNYDLARLSVSVKAGKSISATVPQYLWPRPLMMQEIQWSCNDYATCIKIAIFSLMLLRLLLAVYSIFIHSLHRHNKKNKAKIFF